MEVSWRFYLRNGDSICAMYILSARWGFEMQITRSKVGKCALYLLGLFYMYHK